MQRYVLIPALTLLMLVTEARAQEPAPSASSAGSALAPPRAPEVPPASSAAPSASATAAPTASSQRPAATSLPPATVDRTTPRQTVLGLMRTVESGQLAMAAQYLDLRGLRWGQQTPGMAAKDMVDLLNLHMWLNPNNVSDLPEGTPDDGQEVERIGVVRVHGTDVPVTLTREKRGEDYIWLVSQQTVNRLPELMPALTAPAWIESFVPKSVESLRVWGMWGWQWLALVLALIIGYPIGHLTGVVTVWLLLRLARRTSTSWDNAALDAARRSFSVALGLSGFLGLVLWLGLPGRITEFVRTWVTVPIIMATGWAAMRATRAIIDSFLEVAKDEAEMRTRGVRTHLLILRRVATGAIGFFTVALALTRFEVVRDIGLSLLASAGLAGIALGFAAQKSLGAAIAGLQLSITQPVRVGDTIVWQGQWGHVEEITLTWVRIELNDERRLVVPVEKFLTEAFENWSMPGTNMVGLIEIPVDPCTPIAPVRKELERLAQAHVSHDGRECLLQLTELGRDTATLRARVSTDDQENVFAMRCEIREQLVEFLKELDGGRYLARQRWEQIDAPSKAA